MIGEVSKKVYSFCIFLECDSDLNKINNTLNSLAKVQDFQSNGKLVLLFKRKRYMVNSDKLRALNALLYEKGEHCLGTDEPDEISESIEKDGKDIFFSEVNKYLMETEGLCDITECKGKDEQNTSLFEGVECFFGVGDPGKITEIMECIEKDKREILFFVREGDTFDPYCFKYIDSFFKENHETCGVMFIPVLDSADRNLPFLFQKLPSRGVTAFDENFPSDVHGAVVWIECMRSIEFSNELGYAAFTDMLRRVAEQKGLYGRINKVMIWDSVQERANFTESVGKYLVSCIIPVYKVEKYLAEAIDSVIAQTIGFEENVQLILVNDGSPDDCDNICREYLGRFPDNVVYIEQENRGVSAARNAGLDASAGEYVAFLDGDDRYDPNYFQATTAFLKQHENEIDLVAVPMHIFESKSYEHPLNYKHKKNLVVDIEQSYNYPQCNIVNTVISRTATESTRYNTALHYCEDGEFAYRIITKKMKYGVLKEPFYWVRKRLAGGSATQSAINSIDWYNRVTTYFDCLQSYSDKNLGGMNNYARFLVLNELHWSNVEQLPEEIAQTFDSQGFFDRLKQLLKTTDDSVILSTRLKYWSKCFLLKVKYGNTSIQSEGDELYSMVGSFKYEQLNPYLRMSYVKERDGALKISGFYNVVNAEDSRLIAVYNNIVHECKITENKNYTEYMFGTAIHKTTLFSVSIHIGQSYDKSDGEQGKKEGNIHFFLITASGSIAPTKLKFDERCTMRNMRGGFCIGDSVVMRTTKLKNEIIIAERSFDIINHLLSNYIKINFSDAAFEEDRKLLGLYLTLYRIMSKKRIWLFMDRLDMADDNAEALFRYAVTQNDLIEKYFVIDENSPHADRLKQYGNVVCFGSEQHKILFLFAEGLISSHTLIPDNVPFEPDKWDMYFPLVRHSGIFLQHGITKDDMSAWLNVIRQGFALFLSGAIPEYQSLLSEDYGFGEDIVKCLGLPRFDNLTDRRQKKIVFMPTWRSEYSVGVGNYNESFKNTDFCYGLNAILGNKEWLDIADKNGYEVFFKPHPRLAVQLPDLTIDNRIRVITSELSYNTIFSEYALLITDYSSAVFDFVYIRKPVIYYHYSEPNLKRGYFDYQTMGMGEIVYSIEEFVPLVTNYIENDCVMPEEYRQRADAFFPYTDKKNCERVYTEILKVMSKKNEVQLNVKF